jgi:hypothetical protein
LVCMGKFGLQPYREPFDPASAGFELPEIPGCGSMTGSS